MTRTRRLLAVGAALALTATACGDTDPDVAQTGTTPPANDPSGGAVTIVADDIALGAPRARRTS